MKQAKGSWPGLLAGRETGCGRIPELPQPRQGVLSIEDTVRTPTITLRSPAGAPRHGPPAIRAAGQSISRRRCATPTYPAGC
jgi:hypothetical protein